MYADRQEGLAGAAAAVCTHRNPPPSRPSTHPSLVHSFAKQVHLSVNRVWLSSDARDWPAELLALRKLFTCIPLTPPPTRPHTHTHKCTKSFSMRKSIDTALASNKASSVSKWCVNTEFKLQYFHDISCWAFMVLWLVLLIVEWEWSMNGLVDKQKF